MKNNFFLEDFNVSNNYDIDANIWYDNIYSLLTKTNIQNLNISNCLLNFDKIQQISLAIDKFSS
jgi:hypothetical protein